MTTTTSKDKPGSKPLKPDKKVAPNTLSQKELKRRQENMLAMGRSLGFKKVPFKGVIIQIPEGTDII